MPLQALRDRHQEAIADDVAEAVVDQLESIEVDEQHPVVAPGAARALGDRALQQLAEQRAVRQVGQPVVARRLRQRIANPALLGDVGLRPRHADRAAGFITHRDAAAQHPARPAAGVVHAYCARTARTRHRGAPAGSARGPDGCARCNH